MKLIILSRIRNEADILETFIRYHAPWTFRFYFVDHASTDNSREILRALKREGFPLEWSADDRNAHLQSESLSALLQQAAKHQPDWILPLDGDEFLRPLHSDLASILSRLPQNQVHLIPWQTYVPKPEDDAKEPVVLQRIGWRRDQEVPLFSKILIPGALLNGSTAFRIPEGSHTLLSGNGEPVPSRLCESLRLAHFPVRTAAQLRRKIRLGYHAHMRNPGRRPDDAFHWKELHARFEKKASLDPQELMQIASGYAGGDPEANLVFDPVEVPEPARRMCFSHLTASHNKYSSPTQDPLGPEIRGMIRNHQTVLEVGCNTGYMSQAIAALGCRVTGIELLPSAAEKARSVCERVIVGDAETLDYPALFRPGEFDIILMTDILEHLRDPAALLQRLRPFLKEGGELIVRMPNIAHASVRLELLAGQFDYEPLGLLDDTHLRFFTRNSLIRLVQEAGFRITELHPLYFALPDAVLRQRLSQLGLSEESLIPLFKTDEALALEYLIRATPGLPNPDFAVTRNTKSMEEAEAYVRSLEKRLLSGEDALRLQTLEKQMRSLRELLGDKDLHIQSLQDTVRHHEQLLQDQKEEVLRHQKVIAEKDAYYRGVEERLACTVFLEDYVAGVQRSLVWRLLQKFDHVVNLTLPKGSRRRSLYDSALYRTKKIFGLLRTPTSQPAPQVSAKTAVLPEVEIHPLEFTAFKNPQVSILILVHNQLPLIFNCLRHLKEYTSVPYEIILVDNASEAPVRDFLRRLTGVQRIENSENLEFARGANQAAALATAPFLLFLNSDINVQPGWLEPLLDLMKTHPDCGATGSKLVSLEDKVLEAGGILWQDGTGWPYGRGMEPDAPECNFRRAVDYLAGACFLTRRELFQKIGGFEERYGMYYEDVEYCAALQERGYKIYYQPESQAVHIEHGSGSREAAIQRIQENRHLFYIRNENYLRRRFPAPAPHERERRIFEAREQFSGRRILMIDDRIPVPELGSGYGRSQALLQFMKEAGHAVTFFPMLPPASAAAAALRTLRQGGIEVWSSPAPDFQAFARQRAGLYDTILVSRPFNLRATLAAIRRFFPEAYLIYDAEALFAKREWLQSRVRNPHGVTTRFEQAVRDEIALAGKADHVLTVSEKEKEDFKDLNRPVDVWSMPLETRNAVPSFKSRNGLLFVGGFLSPESPNLDAIFYFVEKIFPLLQRQLNCNLTIAGSHLPESVRNLQSSHIHIAGFVPDLTPLYDAARVFIVPHRFAGGIPLKLLEAMSHGLPAVVSPLIAGQAETQDGQEVLTADTPEIYAQKIQQLHEDNALWERLQKCGREYIQRKYNAGNLRERLAEILNRESVLPEVLSSR